MEIPLSRGFVAIVDADDYEWLSKYKWCVVTNGKRFGNRPFALTTVKAEYDGETWTKRELMHRMILGIRQRDSVVVDHINGNSLDNRRNNLRVTSQANNAMNRRKIKKTASQYKGVTRRKSKTGAPRWVASIRKDRIPFRLGHFLLEEDAALAYDAAAREMFGNFACLNFPREGERPATQPGG